ncbi:uncharacterized protein C8Q71DRAFT_438871 [Rhodofomes roseus]|uniref:Bromo domain-containing protein n=1 Tax=Rhodofomes roseus TaxID=34475 RepID=A0ABQ8KT36_9APHY|nr:uncharacterized protein C8Q71DRAFT_438871 [Rhodofomes roseus]KAH9841089.1 hypothetical protein C8Q71DRAFT_438871 [Rhodofomes roseus]
MNGPHHASGSGLKLVIPSLKTVQALKGQKRKKVLGFVQDEPKPKIPRPIKLKPLKEVLARLIVQIKKKDDYAFFLQPVDVSKVPGYADIVKRPMDLGTMTTKVERGRYRSLEEFADDLKLVTTNAKAFNPPGTIYHTEADRVEAWALEHIAKAAGTVIEYETDWNIDVERDDEPEGIDREQGRAADGDKSTSMDVDDTGSVVSAQTPATAQSTKRKGVNAKKPPGALSESLEADGGLPGAKDGLGAFPPGSDWAELMLALKLKGKRYRTKKQRLRMERGGPPYRADGSLDYTELEDAFSVLQFFVPDPPARPLLTPLYPPPADQPPQSAQASTSALPPFPTPVVAPTTPAAVNPSVPSLSSSSTANSKKRKRRHWTIVRNASTRRAKEREEEDEEEPPWKAPRLPSASDFGSFAELQNTLASEGAAANVSDLGSERRLFEAIRTSVEAASMRSKGKQVDRGQLSADDDEDATYWREKGGEAQEYIRDVVYGGVDGYAYARSIAQFVHLDEPLEDTSEPASYDALGMPLAHYVSQHVLDPLTGGLHGALASAFSALRDSAHGARAPEHVRAQIPLSLKTYPAAERALAALTAKLDMIPLIRVPDELYRVEAHWAGNAYREEKRQREEEAQARGDAAAFLRFAIEQHQEAQAQTQGLAQTVGTEAAKTTGATQEDPEVLRYVLGVVTDTIEGMIKARTEGGAGENKDEAERKGATGGSPQSFGTVPEALPEAMDADTDVDMEPKDEPPLDFKLQTPVPGPLPSQEILSQPAPSSPPQPDAPLQPARATSPAAPQAYPLAKVESTDEDPAMRALRMNLLGLAKRAPLQAIAPLPVSLVPKALRNVVPLLPQ